MRRAGAGGMAVVLATSFAVCNAVFFSADDGMGGAEPSWSDGTSAGTVMVADIAQNAAA